MILKGFKEKSNKKYINSCVKKRVVVANTDTINKIGVLVFDKEFIDLEWLNSLANALKTNANNLKILSLSNLKKEEVSVFTNTFSEKEIGWKGTLKSQIIKDFVAADFDLLINFYETKNLALQLVTAATKAQIKVGVYNADEDLNDLIIQTKLKDHNIFKTELVKYLNILNKLNHE